MKFVAEESAKKSALKSLLWHGNLCLGHATI